MDINIEIAHKATHDSEVLNILLPKIGNVGSHKLQQFRRRGRHTTHRMGIVRSFKALCQGTGWHDMRRKIWWVEILIARSEDNIYLGRAQKLDISRQVTRIVFKLIPCGKLKGIHKNTHHADFTFLACCLYERDLPPVQISHCWHESHRATRKPSSCRFCHFIQCLYNAHSGSCYISLL